MKNLVQPGRVVSIPAPANVTSGEYVVIGALGGVASGDAETGQNLDLAVEGVFDLPKNAASVFIVGQPAYYDPAGKLCHSNADEDSNSEGTIQIGVAVAAAGAGAASVRVRLTQPVVAA